MIRKFTANTSLSRSLRMMYITGAIFMSLSLFSGRNNNVMALQCGGFWTMPCLGESDFRYDPEYTNDLVDQADVWKLYEGYFLYEQYFYDEDMNPYYFGNVADNAMVVRYFPTVGFANNTLRGSRVYNHRYLIFPGLQEEDVSVATAQDSWETSSYEKDGRSISRGGLLGFSTDATLLFDVAQSVNHPIDNRTLYGSGYTRGGIFSTSDVFMTETYVCLDDECLQMSVTQDQFEAYDGVTNRTVTSVLNMRKVSEEDWVAALNDAMEYYHVLPQYRVTVPMVEDCLTQVCSSILTEEWWCETDPNCSDSPYVEPDPALKIGPIIGFSIAGSLVIIAIFYGVHFYLLMHQKKRYRTLFVKRIAETVKVGTSIHALSPDDLAEEFKLIDKSQTDSSGRISKEKLKEFLSSGKAGRITNRDFEALFNAIDMDGNGHVDFIEFCAFLAQCQGGSIYQITPKNSFDRGLVTERSARQLSLRSSPRNPEPGRFFPGSRSSGSVTVSEDEEETSGALSNSEKLKVEGISTQSTWTSEQST